MRSDFSLKTPHDIWLGYYCSYHGGCCSITKAQRLVHESQPLAVMWWYVSTCFTSVGYDDKSPRTLSTNRRSTTSLYMDSKDRNVSMQ